MNNYKVLPTQESGKYPLSHDGAQVTLSMDSPAREVMTDFTHNAPMMLRQSVSIDEALKLMQSAHVSYVLVLNYSGDFVGLATAKDLQSARVLSTANSLGLRRDEMTLKEMMTPRAALFGLSEKALEHARIGDILETLEHSGTEHLLVMDNVNECICGLISAREMAKKLRRPIVVTPYAQNFSEVMKAVSHPA